MGVKKAVITAAAEKQRALPLQTLIDRGGEEKPVLPILIEQVLAARVEDICVVVAPGAETPYGHAVWCARAFARGTHPPPGRRPCLSRHGGSAPAAGGGYGTVAVRRMKQ